MASWSYVLADRTVASTNIGQLSDVRDVQLHVGLSQPDTLQFTARLDDRLADYLIEGNVLIKMYQTPDAGGQRTLRFVGEIAALEEVSSDVTQRSIQVQAISAGAFRLSHRLVGKSSTGYVVASSTNRATIAGNIIDTINAPLGVTTDGGGYTGVRVSTSTLNATAGTIVQPGYVYKPALEAITELGQPLDGFDWRIMPLDGEIEPSLDTSIGEFVASPTLGEARDLVFEYGGGKANVSEYRRQVTRSNLATTVYSLPQSYGDAGSTGTVITRNSATTPLQGPTRHEYAYSDTVLGADLRASAADTVVGIRSVPQQVLSFQPSIGSFEYGYDLDVGDTVTARAKVGNVTRYDATVRVYSIDIVIDEQGRETFTLSLVPDGVTF